MNKLISIIIPCKNGSNYLAEAINGIKKQNANTEIIVVDDGSTDNTAELAKSMGCKVLTHTESKGQVVAKNTALQIAKGDYILFHDHDDLLTENSLQTFYDEFEQDMNVQVVNAKIVDFLSQDAKNQQQSIKDVPYHGCLAGSIMFKKEVFDVIGFFNETITAGEIIDITARMSEKDINIKKIDFTSSLRRIHDTNYGKTNQAKEFKDYSSILRAKLVKSGSLLAERERERERE